MCWMKKTLTTLVAALVCFSASTASAQSELEGMSFEELIGKAKTAYEGEKFDEAIKYLLAANRAQPNARLLLNVAKSYDKSGKCVQAMVYYRAFVRDPGAEPTLIEQAREALDKSDECEGWNDLMSGRMMISADQPGASATIDGKSVGTLPTEVVGLMEGDHTVEVTLEGYQPFTERLNLYPDKDVTVKATLQEAVVVVEEEDPGPTPTVPEPEPVPIVQYAIAGGVGVVGLTLFTVGLITDLGIPKKYDDPRREPGIGESEFNTLTDERKSAATRAVIFYVIGGVLTAGGAGYGAFVAATSSQKEEAPRLTLAPDFGPNGFGLSLSGKF